MNSTIYTYKNAYLLVIPLVSQSVRPPYLEGTWIEEPIVQESARQFFSH